MRTLTVKPTTRTLTLLAVIALLLCFSAVLAYMIGSKHLKSEVTALETKQKQVDDSKKIATRLDQAKETYLRACGDLGFLETSVATYAYVPTLLGQLEGLAEQNKLKVISVRPEQAPPAAPPPIKRTSQDPETMENSSGGGQKAKTEKVEPAKPYEELHIAVEMQGSYWQMHDFMKSLAKFPKIIAVNEIQMSPMTEAEQHRNPDLKVRVALTAFIFKPDESKGGLTPEKPAHIRLGVASNHTRSSSTPALTGRSSNEG